MLERASLWWQPRIGNREVTLHVWDFGGQHVLHGTHEMFLTDGEFDLEAGSSGFNTGFAFPKSCRQW
jgi:hypothetical protein